MSNVILADGCDVVNINVFYCKVYSAISLQLPNIRLNISFSTGDIVFSSLACRCGALYIYILNMRLF